MYVGKASTEITDLCSVTRPVNRSATQPNTMARSMSKHPPHKLPNMCGVSLLGTYKDGFYDCPWRFTCDACQRRISTCTSDAFCPSEVAIPPHYF